MSNFNTAREANLFLNSLNVDSIRNKVYVNPIENKKFLVNDLKIKYYQNKFYVVVLLLKLDIIENENKHLEIDYDLFSQALIRLKI